MPKFDVQLNEAWWALRVGLGGGLIVAGTDKFFNLLTDWRSTRIPQHARERCAYPVRRQSKTSRFLPVSFPHSCRSSTGSQRDDKPAHKENDSVWPRCQPMQEDKATGTAARAAVRWDTAANSKKAQRN
jgi:hypothetical protein